MARTIQLVLVLSVFLLSCVQTGTAPCDGEWMLSCRVVLETLYILLSTSSEYKYSSCGSNTSNTEGNENRA